MARAIPKKIEAVPIREAGTVRLRFPENCYEMFWFGEVHRPDEQGCVWLPIGSIGELLSHGFRLVGDEHV